MIARWKHHWTPAKLTDPPPRQRLPASIPWTLGILVAILVCFVALVFWYMR
jgi:hypothetical protein